MTVSPVMAADAGRHSWRPASASGRASGENAVWIELSGEQVTEIALAVSDRGAMSMLLSGPAEARALLAAGPALDDSRLSRSLLRGLRILASFATDGTCQTISEIAQIHGMSASTAHRYVTTLVAAGLIDRDPQTRQYRLAYAG
jgi:hypothetical protein